MPFDKALRGSVIDEQPHFAHVHAPAQGVHGLLLQRVDAQGHCLVSRLGTARPDLPARAVNGHEDLQRQARVQETGLLQQSRAVVHEEGGPHFQLRHLAAGLVNLLCAAGECHLKAEEVTVLGAQSLEGLEDRGGRVLRHAKKPRLAHCLWPALLPHGGQLRPLLLPSHAQVVLKDCGLVLLDQVLQYSERLQKGAQQLVGELHNKLLAPGEGRGHSAGQVREPMHKVEGYILL
mmetsp:Transcript_17282/g.40549  ORF Transcript_17282/g.40549 Transcript_17282/m.40549 type:complete len:234 (+) Transcript_17282:144-845(+)